MNKPCTYSKAERGMNKRRKKASHMLVNYSGPSYSDLPRDIVENILLRLSIKRIFVCKYVCKTWHDLVSDPDFAKLHLDQAQVYPLIRSSNVAVISRPLYLVQPEQDDFELKLDCHHTSRKRKLQCVCNVHVKLDTKFTLPLRNLQPIRTSNAIKDDKYNIVNSCNGLLCLSDPSNNEPVIVCNPVTGEFIYLPVERTFGESNKKVACGFGFSPMTNQYKVLRIFQDHIHDEIPLEIESGMVAEMHILGTNSWKCLGFLPYSEYEIGYPTYLNGYLYWYDRYDDDEPAVLYFDIEKDCFGSFSGPLLSEESCSFQELRVLGGELCLSEYFSYDDHIDIWYMKDCNGEKKWFKKLSINKEINERWPWGFYQPIKYLNNGALLMFNSYNRLFMYHNPNKLGCRYLMISGMQSSFEVISHIPSFVSFKDAVSGLNTEVFNVRCCRERKLCKEGSGISIDEASTYDFVPLDPPPTIRRSYPGTQVGLLACRRKGSLVKRINQLNLVCRGCTSRTKSNCLP